MKLLLRDSGRVENSRGSSSPGAVGAVEPEPAIVFVVAAERDPHLFEGLEFPGGGLKFFGGVEDGEASSEEFGVAFVHAPDLGAPDQQKFAFPDSESFEFERKRGVASGKPVAVGELLFTPFAEEEGKTDVAADALEVLMFEVEMRPALTGVQTDGGNRFFIFPLRFPVLIRQSSPVPDVVACEASSEKRRVVAHMGELFPQRPGFFRGELCETSSEEFCEQGGVAGTVDSEVESEKFVVCSVDFGGPAVLRADTSGRSSPCRRARVRGGIRTS